MKRRILYRMGKILQWIGEAMQRPGDRLEWFGRDIWDRNCDCEMCQERRAKAKRNA